MMMDCFGYSKTKVKRSEKLADATKMQKVWIDLENPSKKELDEIKKKYRLHPLNIEDCMSLGQRPKMEYFNNYTFVVFKALDYSKKEKIHAKHISMFLGKNFIITVHPEGFYEMDKLKKQLIEKNKRFLERGADFLLYSILDAIVDDYLDVLDQIEDELEGLENKAMSHPAQAVVKRIFQMKRVNITIRKMLWPEREIVISLEKGAVPFISKKNVVYFRDVHDHLFQTIDMNEGHRDIITGILDIYLSSISNSLNEVMKILTIISAFVMIPTLIAGVYGMNFRAMPELFWPMGYAWALGLMAVSVIVMYLWFKKRGWL